MEGTGDPKAMAAEALSKAVPFGGGPAEDATLDGLIDHIRDRRVVMLGESTHGTAEYYELRARLTETLIRKHGFDFVAAEADWETAARVTRGELLKIDRWPTWMWANTAVEELSERVVDPDTPFYGLDVYSLFESIDRVLSIVRERDPFLARRLEQRYACFEPYNRDEIAYAKSLLKYPAGCSEEVLEALREVIQLRMSHLATEAMFEAEQAARIVANAERYYRSMVHGDEESWNVRDLHMLTTLQRLLDHHGPHSKCVVWAHNTHVGDYRATDMVANGYVNLGGLARETFGSRAVALVGFGTYQGKVTAARAWGGAEEEMNLPPAVEGSIESLFHRTARELSHERFYLTFGDDDRLGPLSDVRGHRAVGVVYHPAFETAANYVPTSLATRYDAFVFFDRTRALESLHAAAARGHIPETWPKGA